MRFKKVISGLLVGGLLLSNVGWAFANPIIGSIDTATEIMVVEESKITEIYDNDEEFNGNLQETKVLDLAKQYIHDFFQVNVDETGENFTSNINYREDWNRKRKYVWEISFSRHEQNQYLSIHVTINDEDGKLIEIRKYQDARNQENQIARYTREEAEEIARQFLVKMNQDILHQLILDPRGEYIHYYQDGDRSLLPTEYTIFYRRHRNGIPVSYDGVEIGVNSGTGKVTSYRLNWSEETIPNIRAAVTAEEAMDVFKDNLDFTLIYVPVRDRSKDYTDTVSEAKLAYSPRFEGGRWVDAATGEMGNYTGSIAETGRIIDVTEGDRESFKSLRSTRTIHVKEMNREEATNAITKILETIYPNEDFKIEHTNYSSNAIYGDGNRRKTWSAGFQFAGEPYANGHITIDAITEEVLQLDYHNWRMREMLMMSGEEFTPAVEWEDAYDKAIDILKKLYPETLRHLNLEQTYHENTHYYNDHRIVNPEYYFNFNRMENEINYLDNSIQVSIDSTNGKPQSIYYRWNDIMLPKPKDIIDKEEMLDIYMQQSEAKLSYVQTDPIERTGDIKLVYSISPKNDVLYNYIDAHTGTLLDYNGQKVKTKDGKPKSIEEKLQGHWAERELKIMLTNGVIDLEKFNLKDEVIKNEIIKMMVKAAGYWHPRGHETEELKFTDVTTTDEYYEYLQAAVIQRVIENEAKEFQGYHTVSKEAFAEMLIKITPLEKAAAIEGIYQLPVKDADEINPEKKGAVALLYGLDILKGQEDRYEPKEKVSLETAAVAIYRTFELFGYNRW